MRIRPLLRQVHLYIGLGLSLLLLVLAVTGTALVFKEAYWRAVYPELRGPTPALGPDDHAAAADRASARYGDALRSVKLPEPGVSAYHLYLEDGEAFLSATDHGVIDQWGPTDRLMALLFDLHAHLMAGEAGEKVGGVIGLLGALLTVTGLYLWWPSRRRFSLGALLPRNLSRRALLISHRDLGVLASPVLLVLLLTGSGIVFYGAARTILNGVLGDRVPTDPAPVAAAPAAEGSADRAHLFARAARTFPEARIVFYYPDDGSGVHGFRLRQPCELHPNGRTYVYLDGAGRMLRTVDACAAATGDRALHALYPLHAGKAGSLPYKILVFLGGVGLALISLTGAAAYVHKLVRPATSRRWGAARSAAGSMRSRGAAR